MIPMSHEVDIRRTQYADVRGVIERLKTDCVIIAGLPSRESRIAELAVPRLGEGTKNGRSSRCRRSVSCSSLPSAAADRRSDGVASAGSPAAVATGKLNALRLKYRVGVVMTGLTEPAPLKRRRVSSCKASPAAMERDPVTIVPFEACQHDPVRVRYANCTGCQGQNRHHLQVASQHSGRT